MTRSILKEGSDGNYELLFTPFVLGVPGPTQHFTLSVEPGVTHDPVAVDDSYTTDEDTPLTVTAPGVLGNDTDADNDTLTASLVTGPSHGSVTLNANGAFTYTPAADYNGPDAFTYKVNDGTADSNTATVNLTVNPVNDPPVAVDDYYTADPGSYTIFVPAPGVLANDSDPDGDALNAEWKLDSSCSPQISGVAIIIEDNGALGYLMPDGYVGVCQIHYVANDGTARSNEATVTVTFLPPVVAAVDDTYTTDEDTPLTVAAPGVLSNDTAAGTPHAVLQTGPSHGAVTLNANGSFTYTPAADYNGPDAFTYKVNDGTTDSNTATVNLTVNPVNDTPTITLAGPGSCTAPGTTGTVTFTVTDVDNPTSALVLSATSSNQTVLPNSKVTASGTGGTRTVTVTAFKKGNATVSVRVSDGAATSAAVTFGVGVGGSGPDLLIGGSGPDVLFGLGGSDALLGVDGADLLCGGAAAHALFGGAGNDTMFGGDGTDALTGWTGADRFSGRPGRDLFLDYNTSQGDTTDGTDRTPATRRRPPLEGW